MRVHQDLSGMSISQAIKNKQDTEQAKADDILKYYVDNYTEVYYLICDKCKQSLALEVLDLSKPNPHHHQARQVIPITDKLKSSRPRLDGAMGYQCVCGNDTRMSAVEAGIIPQGPYPSDILPHHEAQIRERIAQLNYHPDIRLKGKDIITETFRVRRIK